jgi:hypothetical protein
VSSGSDHIAYLRRPPRLEPLLEPRLEPELLLEEPLDPEDRPPLTELLDPLLLDPLLLDREDFTWLRFDELLFPLLDFVTRFGVPSCD